MAKSADAFRTISEVADWLETPAHVLRFWESKFPQIKPVKRAGGRRYYRPQDMQLIGGIKKLLHDDGMTIKSVQKMLRQDGIRQVSSLSKELPAGMSAPAPARPSKTAAPETLATAKVVPMSPALAPEPMVPASSSEAHATTETSPAPSPDLPEPDAEHTEEVQPVEPVEEMASTPPQEGEPELPMFPAFESTNDPATEDTPAAAVTQEEQPVAPSSETSEETAAASSPDLRVDVPDDPEDHVGQGRGLLSRIIALPRPLSQEQAAQIRPFIAQLSTFLEKAK